jgi:S-formylglutathione hydrolase FrmB
MAILTCDYFSAARKGSVSLTAVLPVDMPPNDLTPVQYIDGPFPTIYLLHGYSGNRNAWLFQSKVDEWAVQNRVAVIMPDGANRFYLDNDDTEELYGAFVGEELIDVTRRLFPLSDKREDTAISGVSMGGFGAIRNGLKYANTFGFIIAISSALITDEIAAMKPGEGNIIASYDYYRHTFGELQKLLGSDKDPKYLAKRTTEAGIRIPRMFMACGTEDFLYEQNSDYHNYLTNIGYAHEWWVTSGEHNFDFVNRAMPVAMDWLKGNKK